MKLFERMEDRIENSKDNSDKDYFDSLMYYGELILKTIVSGFTACIIDDNERMKYSQEYNLVREDGIGGWVAALNEISIGPTASNLIHQIREEKNEITQNIKDGDWRYEAANSMNQALRLFVPEAETIGAKVNLRRVFDEFARLRNKTRGHGAPKSEVCSAACKGISNAFHLIVNNCSILTNVEWAYLRQNLSGKYRVIKISSSTENLDKLKSNNFLYGSRKLEDGVYIYADKPRIVSLMFTDLEMSDFFFPNGSFTNKHFELLSYITGVTRRVSNDKYLLPADELPPSETRGLSGLDAQGELYGNIPNKPNDYINRPDIENEINEVLKDGRNPVITLVGRGGIGKTSTALTVLHEFSELGIFNLAVWFSARDIDLLPDGAKPVRPDVLTVKDMATDFVRLIDPDERHTDGFDCVEYLKRCLTSKFEGKPSLFVFDNFETLKEPVETYKWINTHIRLPNKVLITTRFRDFKGDYPIEIGGMSEKESEKLITTYAKKIGADRFLERSHIDEIYKYSDGHPYIIKVLIGEIYRKKSTIGIKSIVASKDDMLEALFDRTFSNLSEAPRRVFLLLSSWRSLVPEVAVEAVMLRNSSEEIDISRAIDDLVNSSFVERHISETDGQYFLSVPLTASAFGRQKLSVSPYKLDIEQDTEVLQFFGPTQQTDLRHGLNPRISNLISKVKSIVSSGRDNLDQYVPMLEFIGRRVNVAWLMMADMYSDLCKDHSEAKKCIQKYIEREKNETNKKFAWEKMAGLCRMAEDSVGEIHAIMEIVAFLDVDYETVSDAANRINQMLSNRLELNGEKKEVLLHNIAKIMLSRIHEANADDCSRLGWLLMNLKNESKAQEVCRKGLELDPYNNHCHKLLQRIQAH